MRKAKDIVDEKEYILIAFVTKIFRHRQRGQSNAQTRARRLVHLAEDHSHFRLRQILLIDDAGFAHFLVEIVAFAAPFAHSGEHGNAPVFHRDVVDQLLDDDGFADLYFCVLLGELRCWAMNRIALGECHGAAIINRVARDVKKTAEHPFTDRHRDWSAGISDSHPTLETFRRRHSDGTHPVFTQMLLHFEGELSRVAIDFVLDFERVVDARQSFSFRKFDVHNGTDHLNNVSFIHKT